MACINSTGEINDMAKKILVAITQPASLEQVALQSGAPLYRIRSGVRELLQAGLVEENDQLYVATAAGLTALNKPASDNPAAAPAK